MKLHYNGHGSSGLNLVNSLMTEQETRQFEAFKPWARDFDQANYTCAIDNPLDILVSNLNVDMYVRYTGIHVQHAVLAIRYTGFPKNDQVMDAVVNSLISSNCGIQHFDFHEMGEHRKIMGMLREFSPIGSDSYLKVLKNFYNQLALVQGMCAVTPQEAVSFMSLEMKSKANPGIDTVEYQLKRGDNNYSYPFIRIKQRSLDIDPYINNLVGKIPEAIISVDRGDSRYVRILQCGSDWNEGNPKRTTVRQEKKELKRSEALCDR